jgi:hypothetical protein
MVSTMKRMMLLSFAAALGVAAASPAFAQAVAIEGAPHPSAVGFPFGYVSTANPSGQCWKMTDRSMGYGYWDKCPESAAAAPAPTRRTQRQAATARAAVQAPAPAPAAVQAPAPATGTIAVGAPAAPAPAIESRGTVVAPAPATSASAFVAPGPLSANRESFPLAYVNSPGPDGQCWVMTDRTMGYGYWGQCK